MGRDMRQTLTTAEFGMFVAILDALSEENVVCGSRLFRLGAFCNDDYDGAVLEIKALLDKSYPSYHQWPARSREALYQYWVSRGWSRDHFLKAWCLDTDETSIRWYAVMEGAYRYVREIITEAEYADKYYQLPEDQRPQIVSFDTKDDAQEWADEDKML